MIRDWLDATDGAVESMCDRKDIVEANIRSVKISSPDVSSALASEAANVS